MKSGDVVILSVDFSQILKLLDAAQTSQLVAREVYSLKAGQLHNIFWDLEHSHATQVDGDRVSSLSVPDLEFDFTH